jgi:8-oxo-dGTP diphosphatase
MFTVDAVVLSARDRRLEVLAVQRRNEPFAGRWAMPGGFVDMDEPLEAAVVRELEEETGLRGIRLGQFYTFGDPGRDPRGRSVSTAYVALVDASRHNPIAADDASDVKWLPIEDARGLAFDHDRMVELAVERLRDLTEFAGVGAQVLPERFTLTQLRELYQVIHGHNLFHQAFIERVFSLEVVEPVAREEVVRFNPETLAPV